MDLFFFAFPLFLSGFVVEMNDRLYGDWAHWIDNDNKKKQFFLSAKTQRVQKTNGGEKRKTSESPWE